MGKTIIVFLFLISVCTLKAQTGTPGEVTSSLRFNISINNQFTRQIVLVLDPSATDGVDNGIDALSPADENLANDAYFFLANDRYIIEGVAFDITKRIPLGVKATNSTSFNFSLLESVDFDPDQEVYIYDALDNSYHSVTDGNYEILLTTGVYNNRFEITFADSVLGIGQSIGKKLAILEDTVSNMLRISNPAGIDVQGIALYDLSGRKVFARQHLGMAATFEFPTNALSEGIYLVKISTVNNNVFTKKIIVK